MKSDSNKSSIPNKKGADKEPSQWEAASSVLNIGINFLVCIGLCMYLGHLADKHWGIAPKGTLIGILLGFITAVYSTYKKLMALNK